MTIKFSVLQQIGLVCCLLVIPMLAQAETRYVIDKFEILLRSGASDSHSIRRMLDTGTALEVLERDAENGYSRVQTSGGTEGWVLSRYLMAEPPARNQLERLSSQLTNTKAVKGSSTQSHVNAIKNAYDSVSKRITVLERDNKKLEDELSEIKGIAANVLAIDQQNKALSDQLTENETQMNELLQQNHEYSSQKDRDWFLAGALVLFAGLISGLIIPRIQWRKRSRYDSF